jgi:hypothetical protein
MMPPNFVPQLVSQGVILHTKIEPQKVTAMGPGKFLLRLEKREDIPKIMEMNGRIIRANGFKISVQVVEKELTVDQMIELLIRKIEIDEKLSPNGHAEEKNPQENYWENRNKRGKNFSAQRRAWEVQGVDPEPTEEEEENYGENSYLQAVQQTPSKSKNVAKAQPKNAKMDPPTQVAPQVAIPAPIPAPQQVVEAPRYSAPQAGGKGGGRVSIVEKRVIFRVIAICLAPGPMTPKSRTGGNVGVAGGKVTMSANAPTPICSLKRPKGNKEKVATAILPGVGLAREILVLARAKARVERVILEKGAEKAILARGDGAHTRTSRPRVCSPPPPRRQIRRLPAIQPPAQIIEGALAMNFMGRMVKRAFLPHWHKKTPPQK